MILGKIRLKNKILNNRLIASPMCQYSSHSGNPENWHFHHYGKLINSGIGMLMIESTAISKNARITHKDLVLENKANMISFKKLVKYLKSINNIPIGIQLSHSGRKGSAQIPWIKSNKPLKKKNWTTYAPSPIARDFGWPKPRQLSLKQINQIKKKFVNSAILAKKAGFDCIEIHMAHGYLLHQFLSPISNLRKDKYGGKFENRSELPIQIVKEIKNKCKNLIIGARITGSDRLKNGINLKESLQLVKKLEKLNIDYICVSSGGIYPKTNLKIKKGYNVDLSTKIKKYTNLNIRVSGKIENIKYANNLVKNKSADLVALGRILISKPNIILSSKKDYIPKQYLRAFQ